MRCERICSLARYVTVDCLNPALTSGVQWFERTLDDSANKRIAVAEAFLATDGILNLLINVTSDLVVYPKIIERRVLAELPFMATENIIMKGVKNGGDRQKLHERIRELSMLAGENVKVKGLDNNLCELIVNDALFNITENELNDLLKPADFVGLAPKQTEDFVKYVSVFLSDFNFETEENISIEV
jgi:adenylosuccinate lyase